MDLADMGRELMAFGKYAEYTRAWVYKNDPDYCDWSLSEAHPVSQ